MSTFHTKLARAGRCITRRANDGRTEASTTADTKLGSVAVIGLASKTFHGATLFNTDKIVEIKRPIQASALSNTQELDIG
nr:hypothetical protein [Limnohabitans parvus]